MRQITLIYFFIISKMLISQAVPGQVFFRTGKAIIDPRQVIPENYSSIGLPVGEKDEMKFNFFSRENPYTWLQIISDDRQTVYHVIYQTTFTGRLVYLGISNNLFLFFSKKEKPLFIFRKCLEKIQDEIMSEKIQEIVTDCILERLAYCSR